MKTPEEIRDYVLKRHRWAIEDFKKSSVDPNLSTELRNKVMDWQAGYLDLASDILEFIGK